MTGASTAPESQRISVIIPVLNEAEGLGQLLPYLKEIQRTSAVCETIVVDGGSTDGSREAARRLGAIVLRSGCGRARQMNAGARAALGEILYFLHADSIPPPGFDLLLLQAADRGHQAGCFRLRFDEPNRLLAFFAWFTRFKWMLCRGGDQSMFVPASLFRQLGGFDEEYVVYEDNEFIGRLRRHSGFTVLPQRVVTSARKYRRIGVLRLQYYFGVIHLKKYLGAKPDSLYRYYRRKIA